MEWDPHAPVTPLGQLVYFSQFLAVAGLYRDWVVDCPLEYTSPNAPERNDLLGTIAFGDFGRQPALCECHGLAWGRGEPAGVWG